MGIICRSKIFLSPTWISPSALSSECGRYHDTLKNALAFSFTLFFFYAAFSITYLLYIYNHMCTTCHHDILKSGEKEC